MKARDLQIKMIGRLVKVEAAEVTIIGRLDSIQADTERVTLRVAGYMLSLDGTETVSITG